MKARLMGLAGRIEAIRAIRTVSAELGLCEAKDAVEARMTELGIAFDNHTTKFDMVVNTRYQHPIQFEMAQTAHDILKDVSFEALETSTIAIDELLGSTMEQLAQANRQMSETQVRNAQLKTALEESRSGYADLQECRDRAAEDREILRGENIAYKGQVNDWKVMVEELEQENKALRTEIAQCRIPVTIAIGVHTIKVWHNK